ncbi:vesicle-associated membrane protein-associated protein SCS2-like [Bidens hawaiensis]|uniref:vesicle-associated membrane protein-associated protein SCS2-like n=1 Tax=Bidens hawaiensis TaxID=980011 RepID=UPI00404A4645
MKPELLEVRSRELRFLFELKKQSSCSVQMINKTDQYVAFKIKTTNPKKYCVSPNAGVMDPNASCEFSVTMQAPKVVPPDMISRDKFLIQSTVVPEGTKEEDVTSNMFVKEEGKIVDEKRLKVIFYPPDSAESSPVNEPLKQMDNNESRELKDDTVHKSSARPTVAESIEVPKGDGESVEVTKKEESHNKRKEKDVVKKVEEPVKPSQEYAKRKEEFAQINNIDEQTLAKDVEAMKSKVKELDSKVTEAKATILHLSEEKRSVTQEKHSLQGELDLVRSRRHRAQVGFPMLFVFMVGLVSLYLGYLLHN